MSSSEMSTDIPANATPRRSARTSKRIPVSLVVKYQGNENTIVASTINISAHGLRIQPRRSLHQGQVVYALGGPATLRARYCRVVWISQAEAGLEFLN